MVEQCVVRIGAALPRWAEAGTSLRPSSRGTRASYGGCFALTHLEERAEVASSDQKAVPQ